MAAPVAGALGRLRWLAWQCWPGHWTEATRATLGLWLISVGYAGCLTLSSAQIARGHWGAIVPAWVLGLASGWLWSLGLARMRQAVTRDVLRSLGPSHNHDPGHVALPFSCPGCDVIMLAAWAYREEHEL